MTDMQNELTQEAVYKAIKQLIRDRDTKILTDMQWLSSNLPSAAGAAEAQAAARAAKIAQRNRVLFCVGYLASDEFRYSDIEALMRQRFPISCQGGGLNVAYALAELAVNGTGILTHTPKRDGYMLKAPLYRSCLRNMLSCADGSELVEKVFLAE